MPEKVKVYGASLMFSLFVGFSFLASKVAIKSAGSLELMTYRYDFAMVTCLIVVLLKISKVSYKGKNLKLIMATSIAYALFMVFQAIGLYYSSSIDSGIIFAVIPVFTMIISSIFIKEKSNLKQKFFVCVSVTGVIMLFILGSGANVTFNFKGMLFLFLSSICMATSNVITRFLRKDFTPVEITFMMALVGSVGLNIVSFIIKACNGTLSDYFTPLLSIDFFVAVAYLGIVCTFGTALIMSYMLVHLKAASATIFGNLATLVSITAGVVFMNESLEMYHIVCAILIVTGVVGTSFSAGMSDKETGESKLNSG